MKKLFLIAAIASLSACATYKDNAPSWMPGSNAIKVNLTGAEEVPPLTVPGSGSGTFRVAEDGTVTGSVTTKDVAGTMAHIHRGAKGQNGPVIVPLTFTAGANRSCKLTPARSSPGLTVTSVDCDGVDAAG